MPKEMTHSIAKGVVGAMIVRLLSIAFALGMEVILARELGAQEYGVYSIAITWLGLLTLVCVAGLDVTSIKMIPYYRTHQRWGELNGFLRFSYRAPLLLSFLAILTCLAALGVRSGDYSGALFYPLLLAAILLPLSVAASIRSATLRGLMHAVKADIPMGILRPLFIIILVAVVLRLLEVDVRAHHVVAGYFAALAGCVLLNMISIRKDIDIHASDAAPVYMMKEWLLLSFPIFIVAGLSLFMARIDILMIGAFLGEEKAGVYAVASRIAELLTVSLTAVNAIVAPRFSKLYAMGEMQRLQEIVTSSSRITFLGTCLFAAGILIFQDMIIMMFGERFTEAKTALYILMFAQAINAFSGSVGYLMLMTGQHRLAAFVLGATALLNVGLNYVLIPGFGIEGGAMSTAVTVILWNLSLLYLVHKKLAINAIPVKLS